MKYNNIVIKNNEANSFFNWVNRMNINSVPKTLGDPKFEKRGPKGDRFLRKKGTLGDPILPKRGPSTHPYEFHNPIALPINEY